MQATGFHKRIFTPRAFVASLCGVVAQRRDLAAARNGLLDGAFAEKIMLAVTQVNDCRYCRYAHSRSALREGVSAEELRQVLGGDFGALPEAEAVALAFAQHYAEQNGHPDREAWQRLVEFYGPERARAILAYVKMITVGNLFGNTCDALLSRLRGRPAAGSSLCAEFAVVGLGLGLPLGAAFALAGGVLAAIRRLSRR